MLPLAITDIVIRQISDEIAAHPPERGAAGLGLRNQNLVTSLVPDPEGTTTAASYVPSAGLTRKVNRIERRGVEELKMIVHSHPGRFDSLSGPDRSALRSTLEDNPHLAAVAAPVITLEHPVDPETRPPHVVALDGGARASFYGAMRGDAGHRLTYPGTNRRRSSAAIEIFRWPVRVAPVRRHLESFAGRIAAVTGDAPAGPVFGTVLFENVAMIAATLATAMGDWIFLIPGDYPQAPPSVLLTLPGQETRALALRWIPGRRDDDMLWDAIGSALPEVRTWPARPVLPARCGGFSRRILYSVGRPEPGRKRVHASGGRLSRLAVRCSDFDVAVAEIFFKKNRSLSGIRP